MLNTSLAPENAYQNIFFRSNVPILPEGTALIISSVLYRHPGDFGDQRSVSEVTCGAEHEYRGDTWHTSLYINFTSLHKILTIFSEKSYIDLTLASGGGVGAAPHPMRFSGMAAEPLGRSR